MNPRHESQVLVVGAGPVGLFTALCLSGHGADVQIIDKDWIGSTNSYALALHPRSLLLLNNFGLADELIEQGKRIDRLAFYEGEQRVGTLEFSELGGPFPFVLVLAQSKLEDALQKRLHMDRVEVLWNHQLLALQPDRDAVTAEIGHVDKVSLGYAIAHSEWVVKKRFSTRASFVIGADGYHSFTRRSLGVDFAELAPAEEYLVFEFESPIFLGHEVRIVFHEDATSVVWPMKNMRGRWSFQVREAHHHQDAREALESLIRARAPWFEPAPSEVYWSAATRFERRLVNRFGRQRVWLAGDAAHITGPVGVQSMNVGLREAYDLAGRVKEVLSQWSSLEMLDGYGTSWQGQWHRLLGLEGRLQSRGAPDWSVKHAPRLVPCIPASGDDLGQLLRQIGLEFV